MWVCICAFLNCGLNLFHDLIVEGKKECANNFNLVNGFLNSVWLRKNAPTLNRFKQANKNHTIKPPKFYIARCRILNIIHTRLRHRSSSLNADLFRVHLANDPGCICGCVLFVWCKVVQIWKFADSASQLRCHRQKVRLQF
jgi:hypothetical protein